MRIGLFSDTYRPTINGITYVLDTVKRRLEEQGHEVFLFCPGRSMAPHRVPEFEAEDHHIVRLRSFSSGFFEDFDFAVFFPPRTIKQIADLHLDVIHVFSPSQVGLLGVNAAKKLDIPLVMQHSTDLYEFSENYPNVLPGVMALIGILFPMSVRMNGKDAREIVKMYRPHRAIQWNQTMIKKGITLLYSKADAVIALSRKSQQQLESWQYNGYHYDVTMLPNGVDAIPRPTTRELADFREQHGLSERDETFGFVGRLAEEKNLDILIRAFDKVGKVRPRAKLVFIGDFEYRKKLEELAAASKFPDRIIFTGALPREKLGVAYAALDVFVFPSLKDTQGWVLHEAAHAGLPIVLIDRDLSEVVVDGENGYLARNNPTDVARKVTTLLESPSLRAKFGAQSKKLARGYGETKQAKKLIKLYEKVVN